MINRDTINALMQPVRRISKQETPAFFCSPPDSAAQLVQLAESVSLSIFNNHNCCVGIVDTDFNDSCGYKDVKCTRYKIMQNTVFILRFLGAPGQTQAEPFQLIAAQAFEQRFCASQFMVVIVLFHERTDNICLPSFGNLTAKKSIHTFSFVFGYKPCFNGDPAAWYFVNYGKIKITVKDQCKRSGYGRGGHNQHMRHLIG